MRQTVVAVAVIVLVSLAGCSAIGGGSAEDGSADGPVVEAADPSVNATDVDQTARFEVDESSAGEEWESFAVRYPRDRFSVGGAKHAEVEYGVDTDGDGDVDREFDESSVSGVNNNAYSFTLTLDTGYTLEEGDVVVVRYPSVDNPSKPGDYDVRVTLNDGQNATGTLTIEE